MAGRLVWHTLRAARVARQAWRQLSTAPPLDLPGHTSSTLAHPPRCPPAPPPTRPTERLLGRLKGVTDPEAKRKAIGASFIDVFR